MLKFQKLLIFGALGSVLITLFPWVLTFGMNPVSLDPADWGAFGDYFGGVLSGPLALAGFLALLVTITQQRDLAKAEQQQINDQKYFEGSQKCLQRAFETFKPGEVSGPISSRLLWLTTARWLLSADALSKKISTASPALSEAYLLEVEHTRMLFDGFLQPSNVHSVFAQRNFFTGEASRDGMPLEERSVRVVLNFVKWPEEKIDALHDVPQYTEAEANDLRVHYRGLQAYILSKPRFNRPEGERVS
jgi:hypothetical protein